jgi:hypothetical protein
MRYGSLRPRQAPVVVLDLEDVELLEETRRRAVGRRLREHDLYPPAISDRELRRLVDECTEELCLLAYRRFDRTAQRSLR